MEAIFLLEQVKHIKVSQRVQQFLVFYELILIRYQIINFSLIPFAPRGWLVKPGFCDSFEIQIKFSTVTFEVACQIVYQFSVPRVHFWILIINLCPSHFLLAWVLTVLFVYHLERARVYFLMERFLVYIQIDQQPIERFLINEISMVPDLFAQKLFRQQICEVTFPVDIPVFT